MKCSTLTATSVLATILIGGSSAQATVRRVIPPASGCLADTEQNCCKTTCDGSAWTNAKAYKSIQDAIADASNGDEIWIKGAPGGITYYPDECYDTSCTDNDRASTFKISNPAISLYGGFAGTETATGERVFLCSPPSSRSGWPCEVDADCPGSTCSANETILSGDLAQDDGSGPCNVDGDCSNNAYHVVTYEDAGASSTIDGIVIKYGASDGDVAASNQGAAINIRAKSRCRGGASNNQQCLDSSDCAGGTCTEKICNDNGAPCTDSDKSACGNPGTATCLNNACLGGGPLVRKCIIRNNYSDHHGAINDHGASSDFLTCVFDNNIADEDGGGLLVDNGSADILSCIFTNNSAVNGGAIWLGARANSGADSGCPGAPAPDIGGCRFYDNIASDGSGNGKGGAIFDAGIDSDIDLTVSRFEGNSSDGWGGAIWIENSDLAASGCVFIDNTSAKDGGAVSSHGDQDDLFEFENCWFFNNSGHSGGAIWANYHPLNLTNTLFSGNSAGAKGGAVIHYVRTNPSPGVLTATNCTFVANDAFTSGGAIEIYDVMSPATAHNEVVNSVLWDNTPDQTHLTQNAILDITNSCVEGISETNGNKNQDPDFYDANGTDNIYGTEDDFMFLTSSSPCIDTGDDSQDAGSLDLEGAPRVVNSEDGAGASCIDMGAFEYQPNPDECCGDTECSPSVCCGGVCEECCEHSDCSDTPSTPKCKTSGSNDCVQCLENRHCDTFCSEGGFCNANTCWCLE